MKLFYIALSVTGILFAHVLYLVFNYTVEPLLVVIFVALCLVALEIIETKEAVMKYLVQILRK